MFYGRMQNIPYIMHDHLWSRAVKIKNQSAAGAGGLGIEMGKKVGETE